MTANEKTIVKFYSAFANGDASSMCALYHPEITFRDPVFGLLKGKHVCQMWKMLIERSKGDLKIDFSDLKSDEYIGSIQWTASYNFGKSKAKVVNVVQAHFHFKDGLIIKHTDDFDIWKWIKQAFGPIGYLFGWTGYMQRKIHKKAVLSLKKYQESSNA